MIKSKQNSKISFFNSLNYKHKSQKPPSLSLPLSQTIMINPSLAQYNCLINTFWKLSPMQSMENSSNNSDLTHTNKSLFKMSPSSSNSLCNKINLSDWFIFQPINMISQMIKLAPSPTFKWSKSSSSQISS